MGGRDDPVPNALLDLLDIVSPNETETNTLIKETGSISKLMEKFPSMAILLKLGEKGCCYLKGATKIESKGFKVPSIPVVDTTGAGDCFTGVFTTQLIAGKPLEEAMKVANAAAYLSISKYGALPSMPVLEDVENFLKKYS